MLNTEHYELLAGNPAKWDEEIWRRYKEESLVLIQEDQHRRGRRSAELMQTGQDWCVRSTSGLDGWALLYGPASREKALQWGIAWANEDPGNRELFTHK
jgi:hypothetical protein